MQYPTGLSCVGGGITQGGNRALDKRMDDTCLWGLISSFFSKQSSIISSIEHKTQCFLSCHEPVHVDTSLLMSLIICVYFISFTDFARARNHKKALYTSLCNVQLSDLMAHTTDRYITPTSKQNAPQVGDFIGQLSMFYSLISLSGTFYMMRFSS